MDANRRNPKFALITPSYRNDYELAVDLCASVDRFVSGDYEHILIVPERDIPLFRIFEGPVRRVVSERQLLHRCGLTQLPMPRRLRLPFMPTIRLRQQWWCRGVGRVSGWVTQQLVKLAAIDLTSADFLVFIDSDVLLIRPFELASLLTPSGASRLHQAPMPEMLADHQRWHHIARRLLGVNLSAVPHNYIGNLIVWRRETIQALQERVSAVNGEIWQRAVARTRGFSEYMLYGVYASELCGASAAHICEPIDLTYSVWTSDHSFSPDALAGAIRPHHVALHLQSTLPLPEGHRRSLCKQVLAIVAAGEI